MKSGAREYHERSHNFQMIITASQINALFEDASQMGFSNRNRFYSLNAEGITSVDDLYKYQNDVKIGRASFWYL